jgi:hypothetical protein
VGVKRKEVRETKENGAAGIQETAAVKSARRDGKQHDQANGLKQTRRTSMPPIDEQEGTEQLQEKSAGPEMGETPVDPADAAMEKAIDDESGLNASMDAMVADQTEDAPTSGVSSIPEGTNEA